MDMRTNNCFYLSIWPPLLMFKEPRSPFVALRNGYDRIGYSRIVCTL